MRLDYSLKAGNKGCKGQRTGRCMNVDTIKIGEGYEDTKNRKAWRTVISGKGRTKYKILKKKRKAILQYAC